MHEGAPDKKTNDAQRHCANFTYMPEKIVVFFVAAYTYPHTFGSNVQFDETVYA
jgi:hypothetical protein